MSAQRILDNRICESLRTSGARNLREIHQDLQRAGLVNPTVTTRPIRKALQRLVEEGRVLRHDTHDARPPTFRVPSREARAPCAGAAAEAEAGPAPGAAPLGRAAIRARIALLIQELQDLLLQL